MNTQHLCPVYTKWLQLNPIDARKHRHFLQDSMQKARLQGQLDKACTLAYQTLETAKLVLTALQNVSNQNVSNHKDNGVREDIISYSAAGMYLSSLLHCSDNTQEAHNVLQQCQQQLIAVLPLHATNHTILALIKTAMHAFEQSSLLLVNNTLANNDAANSNADGGHSVGSHFVNNHSVSKSIHRANNRLSLVH
ncbi:MULTISPECIES: hypothetical protein [unclassified Alteromonas]|uniref:hypothetical protein n=1 Tax=unclassified Alteromonas TaxID=2614992 RepID=UPI00126824EE|nr:MULTISPECIES: hypothetical protein [unclassified Alteromonas]